ncbi:hypothetical protein Bbelb_279390 [Branchiostoma belcheri]|nr:hypothetical protein Bbelb_279390 [Branchiostoma belcheri]
MDSNQQRLDNRAAVPSQAGCAEIQPYAEVPLSKIEESTSQDCDTNHTYTYIKDDVHSARQLVEANQHGDEQGRYETIPNELGCTGVEPYAEIPLSNIAVEPVMAEVECHARDEGKDTNIKTSSLQPSVSDSPQLVTEEIETSQTPGLLDISHGVCQMETVPKGTHVPVLTVTDDEMTDVEEEGGSAVQSTSNETVYRNVVDSQESTSSDFALLSKKNRQDRKNTVNETVYRNAADSQESTSREAVLLSGQNHQETDTLITSAESRAKEHTHLKKALSKCGYQQWTFNKALKPSDSSKKTSRNSQLDRTKTVNISIPYIQGVSEKIRRILHNYNIATNFKPCRTLRQMLFHPKDKLKNCVKSDVIYRLKCEDHQCKETYIGETSQPLKERYKQHCRASNNGFSSAIWHHLDKHKGHSFHLESTDILDREARWFERGVKEAIYERLYKPSLNRKGGLRVELSTISCTATSVSAKNPTVLSYDYCQLVQLPTIDDKNITKLSLNWNNITDILNLPYLPKVKTINMNHNLITALRWPWLTNAPCLEHLDLSYNRIVHVSGRDVLIESCNSTEGTASVRNRGKVIEPRVNMTADITVRLTPSNTSRVAPNAFSPLSVSTTQMTPVYQSTFSTVSMSNALEQEQDIIKPIVASVSGTVFMTAVFALSLWRWRRRLKRQRAKALQQLLQASHSLLHNQMYGTNSNQQRLDNRAAVPSQAGCAEIQPYAEVPLSKIEEATSQDCDTNHTYTYIKDDVHSARQLVEATQNGDEQGRYETIPSELGCTGVEPYAEIPLSNIAVEPMMAEVECHDARDEGKDTNIKTSSLQPSVSDSQLVIKERETSQTPGLLDISHGVCQMETVPKGTHVPVATVTDNGMTDVSEEGGSAVQSTSNETVYRHAADRQESASSDVALLSEKKRQDRKNTVNKTVYRNAADSQESTSSDFALLSGKNRQNSKNTVNEKLYRNAADSQERQTRQDRKNTVNETVYRNAADSQESTSREAVLLSGQNRQERKNTVNETVYGNAADSQEKKNRQDRKNTVNETVFRNTADSQESTSSDFALLSKENRHDRKNTVNETDPTVLSCDYCQLVQLPTIDDENITKLSLIWNNITDISNLPYLPKVVTIDMNHNLITALRWPWLTNAPCLEHLDLSYNRIVRVSGSAQTTSVDQSTFSTVSIAMSDTLEEEQDMIIPIAAAVSGTMFMIAALALSLWGRRRRLQRQRAQALQQVLQPRHSLLHNQMYGMDSNQQQLDNRAGCAGIQPYAEVPLSKIEESTSQDCDANNTYTYIKDDVHSARQLVEANQNGDKQGRYETIPNELGCAGVEPYAEIPLSNIAVEPVMAEVECHARDKGKDTNIETSSLQPSVSDSRLVIEEIGTSQTPGLLDISHGVCQMETVPKGTHVPVATVTDNEMTDVSKEGGSAVQSTSNETVYRNVVDSQESTSSDFALLSKKKRQDRKNTVNETVYRNAADSQESTSSEAVLLLGQNRQESKNTENGAYCAT